MKTNNILATVSFHIKTWIMALSPIAFGLLTTLILLIPIVLLFDIGETATNPIVFMILTSSEMLVLGLGTLGFIYALSKSGKYDYFSLIHWRKLSFNQIKWIGICTFLLLAVNVIFGLVLTYLNLELAENAITQVSEISPVYLLYLIPIMLLVVGPMEELLFRGVLQGVLRKSYGLKISIIATSILFGLIHLPAVGGISQGGMLYVLTTIALSIILGYIYELKESLIIPMVAHGVYNSILVVGLYYQMTADLTLTIL